MKRQLPMAAWFAAALIPGCVLFLLPHHCYAQKQKSAGSKPVAHFSFDGRIEGLASKQVSQQYSFTRGIDKNALRIRPLGKSSAVLPSGTFQSAYSEDFSVQFWVKTETDSKQSAVIISKKHFPDKSLASQKNPGWVVYMSGGAWAWNLGSGERRITHERDNGETMPLNDGKWHQLAMTYDNNKSEVRLYYDGINQAIYHLSDTTGFDFASNDPLMVGWDEAQTNPQATLSKIEQGAKNLQKLVDEFNKLGFEKIRPDEFESVIVDPTTLFQDKVDEMKALKGRDSTAFLRSLQSVDLSAVLALRSELMDNPYTVHQVRDFMEVAPLLKIYSLIDGSVIINKDVAEFYAAGNTLTRPAFDIDNLSLWNRVLTAEDILTSYTKYFKPLIPKQPSELTTLTAAIWNIHHGGIHNTIETDGWDSRMRIVEMLKKQNADIILMQETYSHGDFIAAELGYYFATAMDADYLNQGTNISVLSRYPIREVYIPKDAAFMNVGCRVAISETQDIYAMSNWYGMYKFQEVYDFHESRFQQSDTIPILFGGDFNAVPHTDGENSPASVKMMEAGFADAFRETYPDIKKYPGASHENNKRIDQLYYKGKGLKNTSTMLINSWPAGFPSDHYLIITTFGLNYWTRN